MDKELFKERLTSILDSPSFDTEIAHMEADELFIRTLTDLGYDCSGFKVSDMWYA